VVERLFREEWGKMVATLTRIFGIEHLTLAEDVVQEALARALQTWPFYGIPENPSAWIMRVSRNLALDHARRASLFRHKEAEIAAFLEHPETTEPIFTEAEIQDDRLRMIFACCHPQVPQDAQVALALKTLCGFSTAEIASAFLSSEAAVAKRLTRAKLRIREARIPFEIPAGAELSARLESVLQTLYLLFNEGYKASGGERLVREELCHEAIRLATLVAGHPSCERPAVHALLALMLLNAARLPARTDPEGNLRLLEEQDRTRWDHEMIARGMRHLAESASGAEAGAYHLQAGIAACHCTARDYTSTDWPLILSLYDQLLEIDASPVIALNRAVALANVHGAQAGLDAAEALRAEGGLESYYLLHVVLGELETRLGRSNAAAGHFRRALERTEATAEREFLAKKLRASESDVSAAARVSARLPGAP
jgi:RNA polymerase sigma-70 factor (ECF subfamily)